MTAYSYINTIFYYLLKSASPTLIYKAFDVRRIFRKKISFCGCMYLKHYKALKASIKSLLKFLLLKMRADDRYLYRVETWYKTYNLLFVPSVLLFQRIFALFIDFYSLKLTVNSGYNHY